MFAFSLKCRARGEFSGQRSGFRGQSSGGRGQGSGGRGVAVLPELLADPEVISASWRGGAARRGSGGADPTRRGASGAKGVAHSSPIGQPGVVWEEPRATRVENSSSLFTSHQNRGVSSETAALPGPPSG
ncbi:hypothetical protein EYF80_054908 [Liparis tanakae]|uniref:Uncharacterized protein n=1 Tax=Liparis tanakae TaxID=230148 RepID=A0A4Z2F1B1_9TELE|nr:hypothetical protein EYF80_054908 [Liparis tanakae]